jgi:DNA-binding response OmpR family regulator
MGIIMLSAKSQEMDKVTGLMIGADDYVPKPFSVTELIARVDSLYRRLHPNNAGRSSAAQKPEIIESGCFKLDLRSRILFKNDTPIELTQVEFVIMKYFMENPNKAISREEMLNAVWGADYFGDSKIVDVNMRRLRLKIEDDPAEPRHLVAVWAFGYKWVV